MLAKFFSYFPQVKNASKFQRLLNKKVSEVRQKKFPTIGSMTFLGVLCLYGETSRRHLSPSNADLFS
jgi:hypothetical protein